MLYPSLGLWSILCGVLSKIFRQAWGGGGGWNGGKSCRTKAPQIIYINTICCLSKPLGSIPLQIFSRLDHDANEINFVVINLFNGIEIKLEIKEYRTGYGLHLVLTDYGRPSPPIWSSSEGPVSVIQKPSGLSFARRIIFYRPNFYCSPPHVWRFE